jgi:hypothetical protein
MRVAAAKPAKLLARVDRFMASLELRLYSLESAARSLDSKETCGGLDSPAD